MRRNETQDEARSELWAYTMGLQDPAFIHQHTVDALGAQHADSGTPPMQLTFALAGLYLFLERGYTGRQVQQVHATLARRKPEWPALAMPTSRGELTVADVLAAPAGPARDAAIGEWCRSVWAAYGATRAAIVRFLGENGIDAKGGSA